MLSVVAAWCRRPNRSLTRQCFNIRARNIQTQPKIKRPKPFHDPEKLQTTDKYPLSVSLADGFKPLVVYGSTKRQKRTTTRTQIVSPELCDDVLSYHGHSLERHKGCAILDLNPGVGLWSQKLHDFLKPRTHILLDQNPDVYGKYLQPFVDQPGSRYKLITGDLAEYPLYEGLLDKHIYPGQAPSPSTDPRIREPNNSLLVTGQLIYDPTIPGFGFSSLVRQLLVYFAESSLSRTSIHSHGPVRMLLWMNDDETRQILPKVISLQGKLPIWLARLCKIIEVVAPDTSGRGTGRGGLKRQAAHELESARKGLKSGRGNGYNLPLHRRTNIHSFAEDLERTKGSVLEIPAPELTEYLVEAERRGISTAGLVGDSVREVWLAQGSASPGIKRRGRSTSDSRDSDSAENESAAGSGGLDSIENRLTVDTDGPAPTKIKKRGRPKRESGGLVSAENEPTSESEGIASSEKKGRGRPSNKPRTVSDVKIAAHNYLERGTYLRWEMTNLGEEIYKLECEILRTADDNKKAKLRVKLKSLEEDYETRVAQIPDSTKDYLPQDLDDRLSIKSPAPPLEWDKRPFEPLTMRIDEAWPRNRVALLDIEPRAGESHNYEDYEYFKDVSWALMTTSPISIAQAVDGLAPGASELIAEVPELHDPEKGGRLNMERFRTRMLTPEMVDSLSKALRQWPFRPPDAEHPHYFRLYRSGKLAEEL